MTDDEIEHAWRRVRNAPELAEEGCRVTHIRFLGEDTSLLVFRVAVMFGEDEDIIRFTFTDEAVADARYPLAAELASMVKRVRPLSPHAMTHRT